MDSDPYMRPVVGYHNRLLPQSQQQQQQQQYLGSMGHQHGHFPSHFPQRMPPNPMPGQSFQSVPFGQPQQRPLHHLFHGYQQPYGLGPGFDDRKPPPGHHYGQFSAGALGYSIPHGPSLGHGGFAGHHGHPGPQRSSYQHQIAARHAQKIKQFWAQHTQDIIASGTQHHPPIDFQAHAFPLARIKKIMKSDEDVRVSPATAQSANVLDPLAPPKYSTVSKYS
jgi:hypothetical protein